MARWSQEKDNTVLAVYGDRNEISYEELKELSEKVSMTPGTVQRRIKVLREKNQIPEHIRKQLKEILRDLKALRQKS